VTDALWIAALSVLAVVVAVALLLWMKGRPFARGGELFRASRWSRGNRWFPTQVLVTPTSVVHYTPELFGRKEHSIHIVHVASVSIDTNLMLSDLIIETTGGATPVRCHGHRKADAIRMKQLIEEHQTTIYRQTPMPAEVAHG
jgi:cobalamin synthase